MRHILIVSVLYMICLIPAKLLNGLMVETLEECEKLGKNFCYTGIVPDRYLINDAISSDPDLLKMYAHLKPSYDEIILYEKRTNRGAEISDRKKRESSTDCTGVCCSITDTTAPFSYYQDKDGWNQVASTPEFPIRVTFFTEKCSHPNSPCRGVKSTDDEFQAQCQQVEQKHTILLFNKTFGVMSRPISVASGCKCRLIPKNPFKSSGDSSKRRRRSSDHSKFNDSIRKEQLTLLDDSLDYFDGDEI